MDASVSTNVTTGTARLDSESTTIVFHWTDGVPVIIHFGSSLPADLDLEAFAASLIRPRPQATLDETAPISLLPEFSRGFMGHPGLIAHRAEDAPTAWAGRFAFTRYETTETSISFFCRDPFRGLDLRLSCVLNPDTDVVTFQNKLINSSDRPLLVDWFAAPVLPVPSRLTEYLSFHGRWCAEFALERMQVPVGLTKRENRRGRTSHEGFPGIVLLGENTDEETGPCLAAHLGWSGNHRMVLERLPSGEMQLQMG
ncbi:MAG: glycoside hydrolase family 36 N-terminal domain-containing protein, partial [Hyphomicrobiales bacterium]